MLHKQWCKHFLRGYDVLSNPAEYQINKHIIIASTIIHTGGKEEEITRAVHVYRASASSLHGAYF